MGLIVLLTFTGGTVVFGASSKTKTAAGKAYRTFLRNSGYTYFRTFDMNGDGLKELVCGYEKEYVLLVRDILFQSSAVFMIS